MSKIFVVSAGLAEARLYGAYQNLHCYQGHGGTPLDDADTPLLNQSLDACEDHCDSMANCTGFSFKSSSHDWRSFQGDCYFRSEVNASDCDTGKLGGWNAFVYVEPPPTTGNIVYHLFEPKYTGLANKDAGDFKGDSGFILNTFNRFEAGNPEASMEHNVIEMSQVDVTAWSTYEQCNAPGAEGLFTCPNSSSVYCCTTQDPANRSHNIPSNHTKESLPGVDVSKMSLGPAFGLGGYWFSFPLESQNVTWSEKLLRRVAGKCMGDAWRKDAGGCSECPGDELNSCVAECIKTKLCVNGSTDQLQATWDRVFADPNECPDVPLPSAAEPFADGVPPGVGVPGAAVVVV